MGCGSDGARLRVLVADDDNDVRNYVGVALAEDGIEVVAVSDGPSALEKLGAERFDLLLTDIRMPGMDGFELARRAKAAVPGLCVLYMSGFAREYRIDPAHEDFISKPFRRGELLGCVYEITSRPGSRHRLA